MRTFIGIDPGASGGVGIIYPDGQVQTFVAPYDNGEYDAEAMRQLLDGHEDPFVIIERVHSMKSQGVKSVFSFGVGWGLWRGICSGMRLPYDLVTPQAWMKVMLAGEPKDKEHPKAGSVRVARRLFPAVSLLATERCKKPHDGMAEALLMAEYGRRTR